MSTTGTFELLPAIDLRGGQVVRLRAGRLRARDRLRRRSGGGRRAVRRRRARRGSTSSTSTARGQGSRAQLELVGRDRRRDVAGGRTSRSAGGLRTAEAVAARSAPGPRASSSARRPCATRGSPDARRASRRRTGSSPRSTSATAARSARAGARARPGVPAAEDALAMLADAGVHDLRGHRDRARRPARRPGPRAATSLVGLGRGADHRVGRASSTWPTCVSRSGRAGCAGAIVGRASTRAAASAT